MRDEIRKAAWSMVSETGTHQALADRARRRYDWRCTDRSALARVSQWLSPSDPHQLPLDFADVVIEEVVAAGGTDRITPLLNRAAMRGDDRREEELLEQHQNRGPHRARSARRRREECA